MQHYTWDQPGVQSSNKLLLQYHHQCQHLDDQYDVKKRICRLFKSVDPS